VGVGRVLFNPPFHERRRVKENPPYAGLAEAIYQSETGMAVLALS